MSFQWEPNVFTLAPNTPCSAITHIDWPTRQKDIPCSQVALAVCMHPGCEAAVCAVHMEQCEICKKEFCEGCWADHMAQNHVKAIL